MKCPTSVNDFTPMRSSVLIRPLEDYSKIGSIIVTSAIEKYYRGEVAKVGNDALLVDPGDIVAYRNWVGDEITFPEGDFLLVDSNELIGVFE